MSFQDSFNCYLERQMSIQIVSPRLFQFRRRFLRSVSAFSSLLVAASLVSGTRIDWQKSHFQVVDNAVQAQSQPATITSEEIVGYARAVLQMDRLRTAAYTQVKDILMAENLDASQFNLTCTNANNLPNVPRRVRSQVREIVVGYCSQAAEIVVNNGLSVNRFNQMTAAHQQQPTLEAQIRQAMIELQQ